VVSTVLLSQSQRVSNRLWSEYALVAAILIVTIAPQFLAYILAGFAGCAAMPRLVWQFEKLAMWSLIKFSAAFGGISVADAFGLYAIHLSNQNRLVARLNTSLGNLVLGIVLVVVAFGLAIVQVRTLQIARVLAYVWPKRANSWIYRVHRFFTRKLSREDDKSVDEAELETFDPIKIWDKLTPARQQEVGALIVRSLLEGGRAATQIWGKLTPAQQQEIATLVVRSFLDGRPAAKASSTVRRPLSGAARPQR